MNAGWFIKSIKVIIFYISSNFDIQYTSVYIITPEGATLFLGESDVLSKVLPNIEY